jgi:P-type Cu+ transporter
MSEKTSSEKTCLLCSLPAGEHPVERDGQVFCCWGCFHVWNVISAIAPGLNESNFKDHPIFQEARKAGWLLAAAGEDASSGPEEETAARCRSYQGEVAQMACPSCAWLVRHLASCLDGVQSVQVDFLTDIVRFTYDPVRIDPAAVGRELARFGYDLTEATGEERSVDFLVEFGVAAFLTGNLMMLSLVSYVGLFEELDATSRRVLPWLLAALAAPVLFYCGRSILRRGWAALWRGVPVMESLLALGSLTAFAASMAAIFLGSNHYYFDAAAVIITLALFGRMVDARYKRSSTAVLRNMASLLPSKARGLDGHFRAAATFEVGDRVRVEEGETVPLDGRLVHGDAWVSEACLTGESRPVHKMPESRVFAGSTLTAGSAELELTATSDASTLARVLDRVQEGLLRPHRWSRLANRIAAGFFPVVLVLGLVGLALGWSRGGFSEGVPRLIAVLVVACPCALGLATPVVILRAFSLLSQRGVVLSDFSVLERLRLIRHVCFDKTGTVTQGDFRLTEVADWTGEGRATAIQWAASVEKSANHPIAAALLGEARRDDLALLPVDDVRETGGSGVEGRIDEKRVRVGKQSWFRADGWTFPEAATPLEGSVAYWGYDGKVCGGFGFTDPPRPESRDVVAQLHAMGYHTTLLSGDRAEVTEQVAAELGMVAVAAEMTPQAKADYLDQLGWPAIMVGDGINDAPALAAADIGIAVGSASLISREVASVTLLGAGLERLPDLFVIARRANRILKQNLVWAFGYNAVALVLATAGALHPLVAATAMAASSITVLANTLRVTAGPSTHNDSSATQRDRRGS